jgi:hypothetical protein
MRKFYFLLAAFIALGFSAQEAGKAGELLKNEASKTETSAKNEAFGRNNSQETALLQVMRKWPLISRTPQSIDLFLR